MLESDKGRALLQIGFAQKAIQERVAELGFVPVHDTREVRDLSNALNHLGILLQHADNENGRGLWD